ncbi:hypothetical protein [Croceicoccus sp. Ery15]|uniref:hypothetical protein n=1 Tax=Croceicoccus sp. Ery15 TaxID=1703338 RepID=UPI001E357E94|nr:hypothetical protein [Croceicoccus sp. Ery15]
MKYAFRSCIAMMAVFSLYACGEPADSLPGLTGQSEEEFDDQDKLVARSLSIGSVQAIDGGEGEYVDALRCNLALKALNERIAEVGGIPQEYSEQIVKATSYYGDQANRIGAQDSKSPEQIAVDRDQQEKKMADGDMRWQIAIGCLRKLT